MFTLLADLVGSVVMYYSDFPVNPQIYGSNLRNEQYNIGLKIIHIIKTVIIIANTF